jgi:Thioredoxin-like proteins and domains
MSEIREKITQVIDTQVRPMIQSHGGGIDFVDYDEANGVLKVELTGLCSGCPGAQATLRNMVQSVVQRTVPEVKEVVRA